MVESRALAPASAAEFGARIPTCPIFLRRDGTADMSQRGGIRNLAEWIDHLPRW
jgi:hypothetical protein